MYANLHTHSKHSDGGYTPKQLVEAAKREGYGALAVTDHDTISGCADVCSECEKNGLEYMLGVELNTPSKLLANQPKGLPDSHVISQFHIVGLNFDPQNAPLKAYIQSLGERKTEMTRQLFENAVKAGRLCGIEWDEVLEYNKDKTWISGGQLSYAMKQKGVLAENDFQTLGKTVFGEYAKDAVEPFPYKPEHEIIKLIRDAGGIAVIAHPHMQLFCLDALVEMGINGVEVHHPELTEEEKQEVYKYAIDKNLYISGGSDHYGSCSGYYERTARPEDSRFYREPFIYGTSKQYFNEIKNKKLDR